MRALAASLLALCLAACARAPVEVPTLAVDPGAFVIAVPVRGELRAVTSTPLNVPTSLHWSQTIAWLAPDGGAVKKGDVVVRLDASAMSLTAANARREVEKADASIRAQRAEHGQQRRELQDQIALLEQETEIAAHSAPRDETIFSRHEIIDAQVDLEMLHAKAGLYAGKSERQGKKQAADAQLLTLQRRTHEVKLTQVETGLASLELIAPHDGMFVHERNWRGEKLDVGQNVWRGEKVGEIPDMSAMEAAVQVLESEAAGIEVGRTAEIVLDAKPDVTWTGTVKTVEAVAQAREEGSPVKSFEVVVTLDRTDPAIMKPGQQVAGKIFVARKDGVIAIPNQAVFHKGVETWVWVRQGGRWVRRPVELGDRSVARTVVTKGLGKGDVIALADPEPGDGAPKKG